MAHRLFLVGIMAFLCLWAQADPSPIANLERNVSAFEKATDQLAHLSDSLSLLELAQKTGAVENALTTLEIDWFVGHGCGGLVNIAAGLLRPPQDYVARRLSRVRVGVDWLEKAQAKLRERIAADPDEVINIIRSYHKEELPLENSTLDALLGVERGFTEFNQVRKERYDGIEIFAQQFAFDFNSVQYSVIRDFYQRTKPGVNDVVINLTARYGRVVLYGAALFPRTKFVGVELVQPRLDVAKRASATRFLRNIAWREGTITDTPWDDGTILFINGEEGSIVERLRRLALQKPIQMYQFGAFQLDSVPWATHAGSSMWHFVSKPNP